MNSKFYLVIIALIGIVFMPMPVKAETGSITVSNETFARYVFPSGGATPTNIHQENFTQFIFDLGNYSHVTNFTVEDNDNVLTYVHASEVETFTCVVNCTGGGTASYSQSLHKLNWVFTANTVITGSPFKIAYNNNHNIFLNTSLPGADAVNYFSYRSHANNFMGLINFSEPMAVYNSSVPPSDGIMRFFVTGGTGKNVNFSGIFESGTVTNGYSCSYPISGWFTCDITKTGQTVGTKVSVHSQSNNSASYESETTFNTNDVSFMAQQTDGIYINVTMATGDFNDVLVNATGSTINPNQGLANTNQTTTTKPSSGANIAFDKTSYIVGDNVNVSWYLSDSVQNDIFNKKLRLTLNGVPVNTGSVDCGGCISITSQQGFYIYQSTTSGLLQADVIEGIIQYTSVGSGSVTINPPGGSWIAIANTTMNTRTLNNVTYHIGYSVSNYPAASIEMDINDISNGNLIDVLFPTVFPDGTMTFGQVHPIPVGNFSIRLIDSVKNQVLDTKYFTAIPLPQGIPTLGITTPSITTDKSTYFYGDFMQVNYAVDDTNFSNYNYTIMAHVISLDFGNITTKMIITPFADQVGTFTSLVNIDKTMRCDKGLNCWFNTGNNSINLVLTNNTAAITIAYANFTVSATTVDGYGLQTSTTTPTTGVQFTVTTTVPNGHNGTLVLANAGTVKSIFVDNRTLGSGITTFPETIQVVNTANVAYYVADLYGDDGILKVRIPLTVTQKQTGIPGGWTPRQDAIAPACSSYDGWVGLLFPSQGVNDTSRFGFALVWIVAILFLTTIFTKNIGIGISFAFLPYAFFLYLSLSTPCGTYMPTWTGVFIALIIGIKLRWF